MIYVLAKTTEELSLLLHHLVKCGGQLFEHDPITPDAYVSNWPSCLLSTINEHSLVLMSGYQKSYAKAIQKHRRATGSKAAKILTVKQAIAMLKPLPPFVKDAAPDLCLGFEIEGCVREAARDDLICYLIGLYPHVPEAQLIHHDGSIRPRGQAIEIVTPPLPQDDAFERLEWLLATLAIMTDEGLFSTNATCGLHVNLSEAPSFKTHQPTIRERFAYAFLHKLDAAKWKRSFRRGRNRFCSWGAAPKSIEDVRGAAYANHYSAINTQHLHDGEPKARRIEVRAAGGSHYHLKTERLRDYLLDITAAAEHAHASL